MENQTERNLFPTARGAARRKPRWHGTPGRILRNGLYRICAFKTAEPDNGLAVYLPCGFNTAEPAEENRLHIGA